MNTVTVHIIEQPGRNLVMRYVDPETGKQITQTSGTKSMKEARKLAAKWEADINEGRYVYVGRTDWEQFRFRYREEVLSGMAKTTRDKVGTVISRLEEFFKNEAGGQIPGLRSITAARISGFQAWLRRQDGINSETTIQSYMGHLRSILSWAEEQSLIPKVPKFTKLPRAKTITQDTPLKGRPLTDEEFKLFKKQAPTPRYAFYVEGLWLSGLRLEESLEFFWEPTPGKLFVLMGGEYPLLSIAAEAEKGKKDRLLPITPDFAEFLQAVPREERHGKVFKINADGSQPCKYTVSDTLIDMGKKAGIVVNSVSKYASAHDLRRSFGDRWALRVEPLMLQMLMRHQSIQTTMRYYVGRNALKAAKMLHDQFGTTKGSTQGSARSKKTPRKKKKP